MQPVKKQVKLLAEKALGEGVYNKAVLPLHYGVALATNIKSGFPARGLRVIGVTGTNGKTSTCYMIHKMLVNADYKAGLMSTVSYGVGENLIPQIHHMTSQPISLLMRRIEKMRSEGMEILVLEVTSHALAQYRTMGVPIDIAVMTNVTHEHLDYHGSFKSYRSAKVKLFKQANRNTKGLKIGVINADDPAAAVFADAISHPKAYSLHESSDPNISFPVDLKLSPQKSTYTTVVNGKNLKITCHIPGQFNVANSLAAACVGEALGLTEKQIEEGIAALKTVEGRMSRIDKGQDFDVIVDFAHTPDSFEKLLSDLRPVVKGKFICLFGSAGRRDVAKRAVQGEIAGLYCDTIVLTEEDDRDINGNEILDQIAGGAEKSGKIRDNNLFLILDRTEAIKFALKIAKKGDTVILLGKGHEKTIERADGEHPWNEIETVEQLLNNSKI